MGTTVYRNLNNTEKWKITAQSYSTSSQGEVEHTLAIGTTDWGPTELIVEMLITCLSDVPQDFVVLRYVQKRQCWSPEKHRTLSGRIMV